MNGPKLHDAGILALEWCNDNKNFISASADKSIKLWSLQGDLIRSSLISPDWSFEKQICGLKVVGNRVIVMRLDGGIEVRRLDKEELDLEIESGADSTIFGSIGHSKGVVDLLKGKDGFYYSLSYDGMVKSWQSTPIEDKCKFSFTIESSFGQPIQKLISPEIGIFEGKLKVLKSASANFGQESSKIVGFYEDLMIVLSDGRVIQDKLEIQKLANENIEIAKIYSDSSSNFLSISTGANLKILKAAPTLIDVYKEIFNESTGAKITAMSFDEDGKYLAVADDQRRIKIYNIREESVSKHPTQWCNHLARIDSLAWINSDCLISAGVDGHIMAWSLNNCKNGPVSVIQNAHSAPINCILVDREAGIFMSGASDSCIKVWSCKS